MSETRSRKSVTGSYSTIWFLHVRSLGVLLLLFAAGNLLAQQRPAAGTCMSQVTEPGLDADDSRDVYAVEKYQAAVGHMLAEGRVNDLDCLADSLRTSKARFAGGNWKLNVLYSGLESPLQHPTESDWKDHLQRLKHWVSQNPQSITARVALAEAYVDYGWYARGDGEADTVSASGWQILGQSSAEAREILERASSLKAKCPEWYSAMEDVALAQGWYRPEVEALVEKSFAFEPSYFKVYEKYGLYLLPRWYGEEGDTETFAAAISDRIGGDLGDAVYFKMAGSVVCNCRTQPQLSHMSWERIQKGFAALEKQNGVSLWNLNTLALMATKLEDPIVADQAFRRMGDQWNEEIWKKNRAYFDTAKAWAQSMAPIKIQERSFEEEATTNGKTGEGAAYQAKVDQIVASITQECTKTPSSDREPFSILIQVSDKGTVGRFSLGRSNEISSCVMSSLLTLNMKQAVAFPVPPKPAYWVRLRFDPASSEEPRASGR